MSLNLTEDQVIQLAPDAASVKAGKGLATKAKWVLLQQNENAIWGHCQGSGKTPYQTAIDVTNIAFKCSCPSHKFPCKHGLGLLLLYAAHADYFPTADDPDWVSSWLAKREASAEKKVQKAAAKAEAPVDEAAQAKRQASRHQKVMNGIDDLQIWMKDLLRNGLLNVPERAYSLFENIARRMVDAQAPGLASRLRTIADIDFYEDTWKYELVDQLGKLFLLTEAYRNIDRQPEAWQQEIRTQVGYPQAKEEVLAGETVADHWMVLHKRSRRVNDINTEMFWLYGRASRRFALFFNFIIPGSLPEYSLLPGSTYEGRLCFYKGVNATRALFKDSALSREEFMPLCHAGLQEAAQGYRQAVQQNPFAENVPLLVENVRLAVHSPIGFVNEGDAITAINKPLYLQDKNGASFPIQLQEGMTTDILAITGGQPFSAFLLANATSWELNSIWYQSEHYIWKDERN